MTKQLIDGLRTAADWIESGKVDYDWSLFSSCNCGILAQAITKLSKENIFEQIWSMPNSEEDLLGGWGDKVNYCTQTGLPLPFVVTTLINAGMKPIDFDKLEWLNIPVNKRNIEEGVQQDPNYVIFYMRTWADYLVNQI